MNRSAGLEPVFGFESVKSRSQTGKWVQGIEATRLGRFRRAEDSPLPTLRLYECARLCSGHPVRWETNSTENSGEPQPQ